MQRPPYYNNPPITTDSSNSSEQSSSPFASSTDLRAIAQKNRIPFIDVSLSENEIPEEVLSKIDSTTAVRFHILPLMVDEKRKVLKVVTDRIQILKLTDDLQKKTGYVIEPVFADPTNVVQGINTHYDLDKFGGLPMTTPEFLGKGLDDGEDDADDPVETVRNEAEDAPVVNAVNTIIHEAIMRRASDIHIDPHEKGLHVRYRVHGELYEQPFKVDAKRKHAIISRIKIMANLDITERRMPQDGAFPFPLKDRRIDFRVSTMPTVFGEKVVLRILDRNQALISLETIGFAASDLVVYREILNRPHGMILVTGPTGSGKTTTLYASLQEFDRIKYNICTVEDPVEYQFPGIAQVQVRLGADEESSLTFVRALRAFLRQDPDIMLVGEIRDGETASIAVTAAQTGHLVLSTLHTNNAAGAVTRLMDLGIEDYKVMDVLRGVLAQRLVKTNCPHCLTEYTPPPGVFNAEEMAFFAGSKFLKGRGCDKCNKNGFAGRTVVYELLLVDDEIGDLFHGKPKLGELKAALRQRGHKTMWHRGLELIKSGTICVEELLKVTHRDA